jgi:hypothetical protein
MIPWQLYFFALFFLLILPTTSATTLPSLTLQTHNLTLPNPLTDPLPTCFDPSPSVLHIRPTDVMNLITSLVATFSASPVPWNTPEHAVPQIWTHGTVMLSFGRLKVDSWDVFSELQVAKALAQVTVGCVTAEKGWLGGKMAVGPRGRFMVSVLGRGAITGGREEV